MTLSNTIIGPGENTVEGAEALSPVEDFQFPDGWMAPSHAAARSRECCAQLEEGKVLFFDRIPFDFPAASREFLLSQKQSGSALHKNVSYRPREDVLRGAEGATEHTSRVREIMRRYSAEVTRFLAQLLQPYADHWALDYASFRPEEEKGRDLPVRKRNDLLHVDAFPTRPMHGRRILRCFTNINPKAARVWNTTDSFPFLAERYAKDAGLASIAAAGSPRPNPLLNGMKKMLGLPAADASAYDRFMIRFHNYLKEKEDFQRNCKKTRIVFPPQSTWICYTDGVPHAVLSGQYALEQTFIIPLKALVKPEAAPIRVLERLAGTPLSLA